MILNISKLSTQIFKKISILAFLLLFFLTSHGENKKGVIFGKVISSEKELIEYATVHLKGTSFGAVTNEKGIYELSAPAGKYTLVVSVLGFNTVEKDILLNQGARIKENITIDPQSEQLEEVLVVANGVSRLNRSAYNAIAIDAKALQNSTSSLSEALAQAPGMKIRESGGVGSDMQLTMDGFNGKHIKVFIDGVPQEGVGSSFSLNNIPVNYAERIEIYKGVVPVGFGTDAIGGVINIITKKNHNRWFLDASYSYGSFNTHRSNINFGQTFSNGLAYEINAFQNYSDNDYYVDTAVKDFETGAINKRNIERVRRFNDTYHNEAIVGKIGILNKSWADRLMFGFTWSNMYKDIQTGVRQEIVFGEKHRKGYSLMPSVEYSKRDLIVKGLDLSLTLNYNKNITQNVDTASYEYNWRGEKRELRLPGEQSYQRTESNNSNWNGTATATYRINSNQSITFNHVMNIFHRNNRSLLVDSESAANAIAKETRKNISGLSYRLMPSEKWNMSVFGKYYRQDISGPIATSSAADEFVRTSKSIDAFGYGVAGTYFITKGLQTKFSYEKAYRLPTNDEMFGDEDLESGDIALKPENSDNFNISLSYTKNFGKNAFYLESGFVFRNTKDYIQRNITSLSGGKYGATYINHGKVKTLGCNISANYNYSHWFSIGGNFTLMNIRDNVRTVTGTQQESLTYKARIPNIPYQFANMFASFFWNNLGAKGNKLTVTYDNNYMHNFPLYSEVLGNDSEFVVPTQFSHNLTISYGIKNNRYNFSVECQNFTNEKLYDNFSLQKAGRAFYGKVRVYFGSKN